MVKINYLTLLICLFQKTIIDNAKIVNAIPLTIKLEKHNKQIISVEDRNPIIDISYNKQQLS